jgi:hypothetical protein
MSNADTKPASAFPEAAAIYLCDTCGRDVTKHLRPARAHVQTRIGPPRYVCRCGTRYLSGAVEWDHLGAEDRKRRIRDYRVFGIVTLLPTITIILLVILAIERRSIFLAAIAFVISIPGTMCAWLLAGFTAEWIAIAASIWRTRFAQKQTPKA